MPRIVDDDLFQRTVKALCDTSASARALCDLLLTPKSEGGNASPQVSPRYTPATEGGRGHSATLTTEAASTHGNDGLPAAASDAQGAQ